MQPSLRASRNQAAASIAVSALAAVVLVVLLPVILTLGLGPLTRFVAAVLIAALAAMVLALIISAQRYANANRHVVANACQCSACGATFQAAGAPSPQPPAPRGTPSERRMVSVLNMCWGLIVTLVGAGLVAVQVPRIAETPDWSLLMVAALSGLIGILGVVLIVHSIIVRREVAREEQAPHVCLCRWCGAPRVTDQALGSG